MQNKLCLGTVQFGLNYGINNEIGRKPTNEESFSVIQAAIESGITYFDTASVYGDAEKVLGDFGIGQYAVKVISKLRPNILPPQCISPEKAIKKEIELSLERLKLASLDGFLLHAADDFYNKDIISGLQFCKKRALLKNIGVSVYETEHALDVVKSGLVDYIQIPYNVFDQRLDQTNFFDITKKNGIKVFARSSFLQGLLLMDLDKVPEYLSEAKPHLKKFNEIIMKYSYSPIEAALLFSYCHPKIDKVVFGVETKKQLENDLLILEKADGFTECYSELAESFNMIERKIIIPSLWNNN